MSKVITASDIFIYQKKTRCSDTELKEIFLNLSRSDKEIKKIIKDNNKGCKNATNKQKRH